MKTSALHSVKFLRLKRRLKLPSFQVVGVLEALWLLTATNAQDGSIGRFTNEDIAAHLEWPDDPDLLVSNLVECGWLDVHPDYRLVVHDWAEHCPKYVHGALKRHGKDFVGADRDTEEEEPAKQPPKQAAKQPAKQPAQGTPLPNLTKPNLTKPFFTHPSADDFEHGQSEQKKALEESQEEEEKPVPMPAAARTTKALKPEADKAPDEIRDSMVRERWALWLMSAAEMKRAPTSGLRASILERFTQIGPERAAKAIKAWIDQRRYTPPESFWQGPERASNGKASVYSTDRPKPPEPGWSVWNENNLWRARCPKGEGKASFINGEWRMG